MKNPYSVLQIDINADQQTIKMAFRTLAKQYHPDHNNGSKEAEKKFIEITEAYNILSNPESKREIDSILNNDNNTYTYDEFNYNAYNYQFTAQDIAHIIKYFNQQVAPYKRKAIFVLIKGLAWLALGIFITWSTYIEAVESGGGTYYVFYGAIIFGGLQAIRALYAYIKINNEMKKFEEEMWKGI